jgi:hypothetical protein
MVLVVVLRALDIQKLELHMNMGNYCWHLAVPLQNLLQEDHLEV